MLYNAIEFHTMLQNMVRMCIHIVYIYIYIYARDHNFSETSWFGFDGKRENCDLAVVICTFLHMDHLVNNIICYGRKIFRPFKLKHEKRLSAMTVT